MELLEILWSFLVSAGVIGSVTALLLRRLINRAESEARLRSELRYKQELLRLEGEDCLASLILAIVEYCRSDKPDAIRERTLLERERNYCRYLSKSREFGAELRAAAFKEKK